MSNETLTVRSCCDAADHAGHFECWRPEAPPGYRLTGVKEHTDTGWREEIERDLSYVAPPGARLKDDGAPVSFKIAGRTFVAGTSSAFCRLSEDGQGLVADHSLRIGEEGPCFDGEYRRAS